MNLRLWLVGVAAVLAAGCATSPTQRYAEAVGHAITEKRPLFCQCYEQELRRSKKNIEGKVMVALTLNDQGKVSKAAVKTTTLQNPNVEKCVLRTMEAIQYPPMDLGQNAEITYPFRFRIKESSENGVSC